MPDLAADCSRCSGLCCVLLPFRTEQGFGVDKPGGTPCLNLADDDLCTIHDELVPRGWTGCAAYDCQGAGQQVTQVTYAGRSWREVDNRAEMAAVFSVMRVLHARLAELDPTSTVYAEVAAYTSLAPDDLLALDLDDLLP